MKRFERLGFKTEREYKAEPLKLYNERVYDLDFGCRYCETIFLDCVINHVDFMLFNEQEELYFLHDTEINKLLETPFDAILTVCEKVDGGCLLTIEEIRTLENNINNYYKVQKSREDVDNGVTEIENSVKDEIVAEPKYNANMNTDYLYNELYSKYDTLRKENKSDLKLQCATDMVNILDTLIKKGVYSFEGYSSFISRIEREFNKDYEPTKNENIVKEKSDVEVKKPRRKRVSTLINKLVKFGYDKEKVISYIDANLDYIKGIENRTTLSEEYITKEQYNDLINNFKELYS